jgi:hypothetical protein
MDEQFQNEHVTAVHERMVDVARPHQTSVFEQLIRSHKGNVGELPHGHFKRPKWCQSSKQEHLAQFVTIQHSDPQARRVRLPNYHKLPQTERYESSSGTMILFMGVC